MKILTGEEQYLNLGQRIIKEGVWVENERTGKNCLTVIGETFKYDCRNKALPLITTRKAFWKAAIAELFGYLVGFDNAEDFARIGSPTWHDNANKTKAWLANTNRKGLGDIGRAYGVQGRSWRVAPTQHEYDLLKEHFDNKDSEKFYELHSKLENNNLDQLQKVVNNLKNGIDDRGETITFWNPGEFDQACLRPCMHTHTFNILDGTLYLHSVQRSVDHPLGLAFNMVQCAALLYMIADLAGLKSGTVQHTMYNIHLYDNQHDLMINQLKRKPFSEPKLNIKKSFNSLKELEDAVMSPDFNVGDYYEVLGYEHHEPIKYPFSE